MILKAGVSKNNSIDRVARIVGKEGVEGLTLKEDLSLNAEGLSR